MARAFILRPQVHTICPGKRGLRTVPAHIVRPTYAATGVVAPSPPLVVLQGEAEINGLRVAGQIARRALEHACSLALVGRTTDEIDALVHASIIEAGAYPAPLNYRGFPKSICASINHQVGGRKDASVGNIKGGFEAINAFD